MDPWRVPKAPLLDPQGRDPSGVEPRGFGGWLSLMTFSMATGPLARGVVLVKAILGFRGWIADPSPDPLWVPWVWWHLVDSVSMGVLAGYLSWAYFRRSIRLPGLYTFYLACAFLSQGVTLGFTSRIPEQAGRHQMMGILGCFLALLWIPYLRVSRRVANTFTRS